MDLTLWQPGCLKFAAPGVTCDLEVKFKVAATLSANCSLLEKIRILLVAAFFVGARKSLHQDRLNRFIILIHSWLGMSFFLVVTFGTTSVISSPTFSQSIAGDLSCPIPQLADEIGMRR